MAKITEKKFLGDLARFTADLRATIDAHCDGFETDPKASKRRREQVMGQGGFAFFCRTYFPHYISGLPSVMHEHAYERVEQILSSPKGAKEWLMAPRGEAKSTTVTQLGTLYGLVTGRVRFAVLIMATIDLSIMMLEAIKTELDVNPRLAADWPEVAGQGRVWKEAVILTKTGLKVMAAGAGKKLRGMRHGAYRPDFVALDDMENDENVRSPEQRQKLDDWIDRAVLPLGPPDGSLRVIYVGTLLHYDAVLARKSRNPLWTGKKFQSIIRWPDRTDLWDRWEEALRNEGQAQADEFYDQNQDAMNAGAEVSWPSVRPLIALMKLRILIGRPAFDSEQQNDPIDAESALFGVVTYWVNTSRDWLMYGAVDPSLGKSGKRGDPSALLVGGYNRQTGVLDIVEADIRRRVPDRIIEDVIALQAQYHCRAWSVEAVQFQAFFASEMIKRSAARGIPVPVVAVTPSTDKQLRIEAIQPHVANGIIRLHPRLVTLLDQLRHYPMADHDDGPDALEMLWRLALSRASGGGFMLASQPRAGAQDIQAFRDLERRSGFDPFDGGGDETNSALDYHYYRTL